MKTSMLYAVTLILTSTLARAEGVNCQSVAQAVAGAQSQGNLVEYSDDVLKKIGGAQGDALIALRKKAVAERKTIQDVPFSSRGKSAEELADRVWKIATTQCAKELRSKVEEVVADYRKCRSGTGATQGAVTGGIPGVAAELTKKIPAEAPVERIEQPAKSGAGADAGK